MRTMEEINGDLAEAMKQQDPDAMDRLAEEVEQLDPSIARLQLHNIRATSARLRGHYRESLDLNYKALSIHEEDGNRSRAATTLGNIGNTYADLGETEKANEYRQRALVIFLELGKTVDAARILVTIGVTKLGLGFREEALECYHRALAYYEAANPQDDDGVAMCLGNIGIIFSEIDDYSNALEYLFKALALFDKIGSISEAARIHGCIGQVYSAAGNTKGAIEGFQYALDIAVQLHNPRLQVTWLDSLGAQYWTKGAFEEALSYFYIALDLEQTLERTIPNVHLLLNIVVATKDSGRAEEARRLFAEIDVGIVRGTQLTIFYKTVHASLIVLDGDHDQAVLLLKDALDLAVKSSHRGWESKIYKQLRDVSQERNDLAGYIEYNNAWQKVVDELRGADATRRLALQEKKVELDAERRERERERAVLYSTLPKHVADRVIKGEAVNDHFESASVLFLDIVGFTAISDRIPPGHVVHLLKVIFKVCDTVCATHGITKVKTIGDSYMAVAGVSADQTDHAYRAACAAIDMVSQLAELRITMDPSLGDTSWTSEIGEISVRIGLHCGPIVAGVVGEERLQYDVWGDTVNVASRMESTGEAGRVHVSEAFASNLKSDTEYTIQNSMIESDNQESHEVPLVTRHSSLVTAPMSLVTTFRGTVDIKGKGPMQTFWLERGDS